MNIVCRIFGHKWDRSNKYKQYCKRKKCSAFRSKYSYMEKIHWRTFDLERIKLKKLKKNA